MHDRRFAARLARLYPPSFRDAVGDDFIHALVDLMRARRRAGRSNGAIRARALADALRNAPAAWLESTRERPIRRDDAQRNRTMMDKIRQDVRYAVRAWRRRPAFAAIAILTLALGIGANTAMFSIVNAVLLRPLPYAHADRLMSVWGQTAAFRRGLLSFNEYDEIRRQSGTIDALALYLGQSVNLTAVSEPQRVIGVFATGSFFDVLGLKAERGRLFTEEESAPGTVKAVVVITRHFWQQRYGGRDEAIGSTLTLNGTPLTIVGVLAPPFDAATVPDEGSFISGDVFLPAALFPTPHGVTSAGPVMLGLARLKPGVGVAAANADLDVVARRLLSADPVAQAGRTVDVEPAQDAIVGNSRPALLLLFAAVGLVLVIACVNVSHLLLARAIDRQREIALRAALGASRLAVTRQLAIEAALMAAASAAFGLALGRWALQALTWLRPPSVPIPDHIPLDSSVLLFTGTVAVIVAVLCGVAPAFRASRHDLNRVLQAGALRGSGAGRRTRDVLVVVEMALSVTLVALSALMIQSLVAAQRTPLGFDPSNVFTLQFRLPQSKYSTPEEIARFFKIAIERVRAVPGIQSAALARAVPFSGNGGTTGYAIEGRPSDPGSLPQARFHLVTPDYFKTLRIPLLNGRDFADGDDLHAPLVAVINETFARRGWPGEDPIGKRFRSPDAPAPLTIIGVVGDTKHYTATEPAVPQLYVSHYQVPLIFSSLVARTIGPPMSVTNDVRRAIWSVDKDQPMWTIRALDAQVDGTQGQSRFLAMLLALFAGVAVLLAAVGIYGVTSYGVAQRTREIGIRLALGASGDRVLREVVGHGARLALVAVLLGVISAVGLGRLASALLFGVTPTDPVSLATAGLVLGVVSVAACYFPGRRAARVDPAAALSEE